MANKKLIRINRGSGMHWVGDGFPVNTLFSYHHQADEISPFLLLDYAGPTDFSPSKHRRGVGFHPHRGFETVTIVYQGALEHKDSAGNSGKIGPGDVQWMTAARGILHEEMHSQAFTEKGGSMEMVQLWVNLPAKDKMTKPGYQEITKSNIPVVILPNKAGELRVIAGSYGKAEGPAKTFTPVSLLDINLEVGKSLTVPLTEGHNTMILLRRGQIKIVGADNSETINAKELALFSQEGNQVLINSLDNSSLLLLSGEPLNEPVVGYGPFVMNTQAEINQALADFRAGKF
ncbi:MAG TPA: pirin family protein [Alphaproteobacteria bacterium]|jgi:hypothetical protein|nr:pirin family protein [Alphaproteobacteria bacterium]